MEARILTIILLLIFINIITSNQVKNNLRNLQNSDLLNNMAKELIKQNLMKTLENTINEIKKEEKKIIETIGNQNIVQLLEETFENYKKDANLEDLKKMFDYFKQLAVLNKNEDFKQIEGLINILTKYASQIKDFSYDEYKSVFESLKDLPFINKNNIVNNNNNVNDNTNNSNNNNNDKVDDKNIIEIGKEKYPGCSFNQCLKDGKCVDRSFCETSKDKIFTESDLGFYIFLSVISIGVFTILGLLIWRFGKSRTTRMDVEYIPQVDTAQNLY
jgi:hypothetical protein